LAGYIKPSGEVKLEIVTRGVSEEEHRQNCCRRCQAREEEC